MTEERIKELAEEWHRVDMGRSPEGNRRDVSEWTIRELEALIAEVAAEARKEGVDGLWHALLGEWRYRSNVKTVTLHDIEKAAEELKEQG